MSIFHYIGRDSVGEKSSGSLEAHTSIEAMNQLRRRGLRVERLQSEEDRLAAEKRADLATAAPEEAGDAPGPAHGDAPETADVKLGIEELAEIAGRIAGITKSQLPLLPGLRALAEGLPSRSLRRGLNALCVRLERGEPLEEALQGREVTLPPHLSGLIVVGIRTGRLGEMMDWFLHHVRRQTDLRRRCRASLLYPVVLLTAGVSAMLVGLVLIVPAVRQCYNDFAVQLPELTLGILAASDFVRQFGLEILAAVLLVVGGVPILLWLLGGRPLFDRSLAGTPFIGTMFRCSSLAGFCELLSMFVSARLPLPQAVRFAGEGCRDADLEEKFDTIAQCLEQGQDDADLFGRLASISPQLTHVFHWKNREANFTEALKAAVRIYENQARMQITLAGMLIEPMVIIGVLGGVAIFAVAIFLPFFKLLNSLV
jgi:type II secretory pathway component PulF